MKLYKAVDAIANAESLFLVYPSGEVATMFSASVETVRAHQDMYLKGPAKRFNDAIDPVLIAEWE